MTELLLLLFLFSCPATIQPLEKFQTKVSLEHTYPSLPSIYCFLFRWTSWNFLKKLVCISLGPSHCSTHLNLSSASTTSLLLLWQTSSFPSVLPGAYHVSTLHNSCHCWIPFPPWSPISFGLPLPFSPRLLSLSVVVVFSILSSSCVLVSALYALYLTLYYIVYLYSM